MRHEPKKVKKINVNIFWKQNKYSRMMVDAYNYALAGRKKTIRYRRERIARRRESQVTSLISTVYYSTVNRRRFEINGTAADAPAVPAEAAQYTARMCRWVLNALQQNPDVFPVLIEITAHETRSGREVILYFYNFVLSWRIYLQVKSFGKLINQFVGNDFDLKKVSKIKKKNSFISTSQKRILE